MRRLTTKETLMYRTTGRVLETVGVVVVTVARLAVLWL
jgi:hypothetical protein